MTPTTIIVHHQAGFGSLESVDILHKERGFNKSSLGFYVGYHYYIDLSGIITPTRSDFEEGAHTLGGWNRCALGLGFQGNTNLKPITEAQRSSHASLLRTLQERHNIPNSRIFSHSELWPTECPGLNLNAITRNYRRTDLFYIAVQVRRIAAVITEIAIRIKGRLKPKPQT